MKALEASQLSLIELWRGYFAAEVLKTESIKYMK